MHEEVRRADLGTLAREYAVGETRGEIVLVIAPGQPPGEIASEELDDLIRDALNRLSLKEAVVEIAAITGAPRRTIYQRALKLKA